MLRKSHSIEVRVRNVKQPSLGRSLPLSVLVTLVNLVTTAVAQPAQDYHLWYTKPAANWNQALPIGNGRLGAMGDNPNPFFKVPQIRQPIVHPTASPSVIEISVLPMYDLATKKGRMYHILR